MSDLHIPDISKYQTNVDMSKVGPAVILRAHNGSAVDPTFHDRQAQARAHCQVIGYYGYCKASLDPVEQAHEMAGAVGRLHSGEFAVCDLEEGSGDQSARAIAYCDELDRLIGGKSWVYSGEAFDHDHLTHVSGRRLWIAAYRAKEPTGPHSLWQHSDAEPHPGIGKCDCSVFHGTVQQLHDLVSPPAPKPGPKPPAKQQALKKNPYLTHLTACALGDTGPAVQALSWALDYEHVRAHYDQALQDTLVRWKKSKGWSSDAGMGEHVLQALRGIEHHG